MGSGAGGVLLTSAIASGAGGMAGRNASVTLQGGSKTEAAKAAVNPDAVAFDMALGMAGAGGAMGADYAGRTLAMARTSAPVPVARAGGAPAANTQAKAPQTASKGAGTQAKAGAAGCGEGGCGLDPTCFTAGTLVATASGLVPIETIEVGDRVLSPGDDPAQIVPTDVDKSWRIVHVTTPSPDRPEDTIDIALLRPGAWVDALGAKPGSWVPLTLAELGVDGFARVRAIERAPPVRDGPGHVVLMTIAHENRSILRMRLRETGEVIEPTALHPLYSVDREGWTKAGQLRIGERVRAEGGPLTIEELSWRAPGQVFNFEIEKTHAYLVGHSRVWSHNAPCPPGAPAPPGAAAAKSVAAPKARFISQPDGTLVDTRATPKGSYQQPNGARTDILQAEDHGAGLSHTHDLKMNVNPKTGQSFVNGLQNPGRPVSAADVENIESGRAGPAPPKGR